MLRPIIAATALLAIAGSSYVYAQQNSDGYRGLDNGRGAGHHHRRLSANDMSAFADARIAALKAGLELTPDQAKNWPSFEAALRNMLQLRMQRIQARQAERRQGQSQGEAASQGQAQAQGQPQAQEQAQAPAGPFGRLARRADAMSKMGAALKQIADSGTPLYQSLTDDQKSRFTMLARMLRPRNRQANLGGWQQGRGYGRDSGPGGRHEGRRFGQNDRGWERDGHRFAQNGDGWGHGDRRFGENGRGPGGRMHHRMDNDSDQDSQL